MAKLLPKIVVSKPLSINIAFVGSFKIKLILKIKYTKNKIKLKYISFFTPVITTGIAFMVR